MTAVCYGGRSTDRDSDDNDDNINITSIIRGGNYWALTTCQALCQVLTHGFFYSSRQLFLRGFISVFTVQTRN